MSDSKLIRRIRRWKFLTFLFGILFLVALSYNIYQKSKSKLDQASLMIDTNGNVGEGRIEDQIQIYEANTLPGFCIDNLQNLGQDSNYIKISMTLKGKELHIQNFELNNKDFASGAIACITTNQDNTEHIMTKYISFPNRGEILPMFTRIRSDIAGGNDFEFSIKIYNLKDEIIGKFPEQGEVAKGKILALALPAIIKTNIKLNRL